MSAPTPDERPTLDYRTPVAAGAWPAGWTTRGVVRAVAALLGLVAVAALIIYFAFILPHRAVIRQVDVHVQTLNVTVPKDPRFAGVFFINGSDGVGVLKVCGHVSTTSDLTALRQTVGNLSPSVPVEWTTVIRAAPVTVPAAGPVTTRSSR